MAMRERSSEELGGQEPRAEDACTAPSLLTVKDESRSHLTSGSLRGGNCLKHEKSVSERLDGTHAGEKAGGSSVHNEKASGTASADKSKKTRAGELPFTKQERDEMETLLNESCGHLGQYSIRVFFFSAVLRAQLHLQLCFLLDFWKAKTSRRIFCSTLTNCCPYQYTTKHR